MYGVSGYTHMWLDFWVDTCRWVGRYIHVHVHVGHYIYMMYIHVGRWGNRQKDLGTGEVGR